MADAIVATWHGGNYQARVFWQNALCILMDYSPISEVSFEADGPKAFDDVVVKYDPPIARSGSERVSADYHQIKWHVDTGGRFGYKDLTNPEFIGATAFSLLERLQRAKETAPSSAQFTFLTTYRIRDDDPLAPLISGNDNTLLIRKLFDGTTDRSRMGKIRKCWRQHLALDTDDELKDVVSALRIVRGHLSLDLLRDDINLKASIVGTKIYSNATSDFRYDELARQLKIRKLNTLTRDSLLKFCEEEGFLDARPTVPDPYRPIAIRSFLGPSADVINVPEEDLLMLTGEFRERYLQDGRDWQGDIRPKVETFLRAAVKRSSRLRLILDAHASIAFLAGTVLHLKSGVDLELVQKGRVGTRTWRADDGSAAGAAQFLIAETSLGQSPDIALAISIAQPVEAEVQAYVAEHLASIGRMIALSLPDGPGQRTVAGGEHAAILAEQITYHLKAAKADNTEATVHLFAACPNSLLFFLGQHHQNVSPTIVYEYDYDNEGFKTYQPSFTVD